MFEKIKQNNMLFAIVLFAFMTLFGVIADKNFYRYKLYGEMDINNDFDSEEADAQSEYSVNFPFKAQLISLNGLGRRIAGQQEMNGVVKLNNGYLTEVSEAMSDESIKANADELIKYSEYCKEHNIVFLYATPAYKISKYDSKLPAGVSDGHNETVDRMLEKLTAGGVDVLDLRQCMYEDGIDQYDMYYRTDHHWTTEGAFYAYQKIATWVSEKTNSYLDVELLDINNYQIDTYKKWHLGARGQKTGALYSGIDDFKLIYPKFETHIYNSETGEITSFNDATVDMRVFEERNSNNRFTYDTAYNLTEINNLSSLDAKTDLSVLLLSDSFQQAIKPYMLLTYREFNIVGDSNITTDIIEQYKPDVVIMVPWPGYLSEDGLYYQFIDNASQIQFTD